MKGKIDSRLAIWLNKLLGKNLNELVLVLDPKGIKTTQLDTFGYRMVDAYIEKEDENILIWNVENEVKIPIMDLQLFNNIIANFNGLLDIETDEEKVIMKSETEKGKRKAEYILAEESYIKSKSKDIKMDDYFMVNIPLNVINRILKDIAIIPSKYIGIVVKNKTLSFIIGEKKENRMVESVLLKQDNNIVMDVEREYFGETFSSLTEEEITLGLKDNFPLCVIEKAKCWQVINYLATVEKEELIESNSH